MRIVDAASDWRNNWRAKLYRAVLRRRNRWFRDEQLEPGHVYMNRMSGELFTVQSIGPQVSVKRHDADARRTWSVDKKTAVMALDFGLIEHAERRCPRCPTRNR